MAEDKKPTLEEMQEQLEAALDSVEKLTKKNKELIEEKRRARDGGESRVSEIEAKLDEMTGLLEAERKAHEKTKKIAAAAEKDLSDKLNTRNAAYERVVRDEAIAKHIAEVGVKKEFFGAVASLIRDRVQVDQETGQAFAVVKDKDGKEGKKSVSDYIKEWSGSDEGKAFVVAPQSSGGGAVGTTGNAGISRNNTGNPWKKESWNMTKQLDLIRSDRAAASKLAAEAGVDLKLDEKE